MIQETTKSNGRAFGSTMVMAVVGLGLLWARSYHRADTIAFFSPQGDIQVLGAVDGSIELFLSSISLGRERSLSLRWDADNPKQLRDGLLAFEDAATHKHHFGTFEFLTGNANNLVTGLQGQWLLLRCPDWLPMAGAASGLFVSARRWWTRYSRRKRGLCVNCGYDLRASPSVARSAGRFQLLIRRIL